jgi:hypothetical protein
MIYISLISKLYFLFCFFIRQTIVFWNKAKALPIPLIKKKSSEVKLQGAKLPTKAYSRGIMALKYLAPAKPHNRALLLIIEITLTGMEAMFLKILAFLSFQISQAVRSSKEVSPFLRLPLAPETVHHHSSIVLKSFLSEAKYINMNSIVYRKTYSSYVISYVMLFVQCLTAQFCVVDRQHRCTPIFVCAKYIFTSWSSLCIRKYIYFVNFLWDFWTFS